MHLIKLAKSLPYCSQMPDDGLKLWQQLALPNLNNAHGKLSLVQAEQLQQLSLYYREVNE